MGVVLMNRDGVGISIRVPHGDDHKGTRFIALPGAISIRVPHGDDHRMCRHQRMDKVISIRVPHGDDHGQRVVKASQAITISIRVPHGDDHFTIVKLGLNNLIFQSASHTGTIIDRRPRQH